MKTKSPLRNQPSSATLRGWPRLGLLATGAIFVAVLLAVPLTSAAGSFSLQFNPPYSGAVDTVAQQYHSGCNAFAHLTRPLNANLTTGHLGFGMVAGSGGCLKNSTAGISAGVGFRAPNFVASASGHPTVHIRINSSWSFAISATNGSRPGTGLVQADLIVGSNLWDNTSGTPFVVATFYFTAFSSSASGGNASGNGSGLVKILISLPAPQGLQAGHVYFVETAFNADLYGSATSGGRWSGFVQVGSPASPNVMLGVSIY